MKHLLAQSIVAGYAIGLSTQKVLWIPNCGDTVGALPAGMGDTFGAMNLAVKDINTIFAGTTYTVAYVPLTARASWSYSVSAGETYLASPRNLAACTLRQGAEALENKVASTTTPYIANTQSSLRRQSPDPSLTSVIPAETDRIKEIAAINQHETTSGSSMSPTRLQNVVYWGQHGGQVHENELTAFCTKEAGIDIIILAFLFQYGNGQVIPTGFFGLSCIVTPSGEGEQCEGLAHAIETCRANGIKVLLSLGGASGQYSLSSDHEAVQIGQYLWHAYGNSVPESTPRPFGRTFVDGWDFNIEQNSGNAHYDSLIAALRSNFASDPNTRYFITGAPQCPIPEPNMGEIMAKAKFDYVWVQFYNNPECSVNRRINFQDWADLLKTTPSTGAKIFIGVPAHPHAANGFDSGAKYYLSPSRLASLVAQFRNEPAFGGIMLWAAGLSEANTENSCTYAQQAKSILNHGQPC